MTLPTEDGIYEGIRWEDYKRIDRVNWSKLKHMKRSPFHFRAAQLEQDEDTDAMLVGRACHVAVLEPERWLASYAIWDGGRRYGKEWDKFKAANEGMELLTAAQRDQVIALQKAVLADKDAREHLQGGAAELTVLWTHVVETLAGLPGFAIRCKARLDATGKAITDLKTTRDASPEAFTRQCWNLDYYGQAAFYVDGYAAATRTSPRPYAIVAAENYGGNAVQLYRLPERSLDHGRVQYRSHLEVLNQCRLQNRWPGYADGPVELELPRWAQEQDQEDDSDISGLSLEFDQEQHA